MTIFAVSGLYYLYVLFDFDDFWYECLSYLDDVQCLTFGHIGQRSRSLRSKICLISPIFDVSRLYYHYGLFDFDGFLVWMFIIPKGCGVYITWSHRSKVKVTEVKNKSIFVYFLCFLGYIITKACSILMVFGVNIYHTKRMCIV